MEAQLILHKSSRALGSVSRYFAQTLSCFIASIFRFITPLSVVLELCNWRMALLPSNIDCNQTRQLTILASLLGCQAHSFCPDDPTGRIVIELGELTDKMDTIYIHVKILNREIKWRQSIFVLVSNCTAFHIIPLSDASVYATKSQQNVFMNSSLNSWKTCVLKIFETVKHQSIITVKSLV